MENSIPPVPPPPVVQESQEITLPAQPESPRAVAPVWHTLLIVAFVLFNSYASSLKLGGAKGPVPGRTALYVSTMLQDLLLLAFIWFGLWRRKTSLRELIGGRWRRIEDFLIDVGIAVGFWLSSALMLAGMKYALGLASADSKTTIDSVKQAVGPLMPQSIRELLVFVALTVVVGFFEEVLFRGYLQRQFIAVTRNPYAGIAIAAALFGAAHGYQGVRYMVLLAVYGMFFGLLAYFRKSLRPGMMAHTWQDAFSGIAFFILTKYKLI